MSQISDNNQEKSSNEFIEPILDAKNQRFSAYPLDPAYNKVWDLYKKQLSQMWTAEEVDFSGDYNDFQSLSTNEQFLIKRILAFFATSDGIVNWNLGERFIKDIQINEILFGYRYQMMMEDIHSEVYSLMLENIVRDLDERVELFNAIETVPSIKKMANWAFKWIESDKSFAYRVVAFALVEGVFFSGAFAAIFWLKKYKNNNSSSSKQFMNGLVQSNKFIARDEGMHCKFACAVYEKLVNKLSYEDLKEIVVDAVQIAQEFMTDALPTRLIGINDILMRDYIEYNGDYIATMLGYNKIFHKKCPFNFMKTIGLPDKKNFFEIRPDEYQDAHVFNKNKSILIDIDNF